MLEVVNGVRRVLWVMLYMLFCILEAAEGQLRLLEVLKVVLVLGRREGHGVCAVGAVMCCVPICMLEPVHGRCVMYAGGRGRWAPIAGASGGDALCAGGARCRAPYAVSVGDCAVCARGNEGRVVCCSVS